MRKIIVILIFFLGILGNTKAQTQVSAGTGQTLTAVHTLGNTFAWTITDDATSTSVAIPGAGNSVTFNWPGVADMYTITVVTTDGNGCKSEPYTQRVQVVGAGTVQFADATGDVAGVCSTVTDVVDGSSSFDVDYTGATPWDLNYSIIDYDGNPVAGFNNIDVLAIAGNTTKVIVNHEFENLQATAKKWKVVINSATSHSGVSAMNTIGKVERTIEVYPKPVITNISLN